MVARATECTFKNWPGGLVNVAIKLNAHARRIEELLHKGVEQLAVIRRQSLIGNMYTPDKSVIESMANPKA